MPGIEHPDEIRLRVFLASRHRLQGVLKEILQAVGRLHLKETQISHNKQKALE